MQEMQGKTLAEIAKAFTGSFIYAPGGTVNIGCNIFEANQAPKKKAKQNMEQLVKEPKVKQEKAITKKEDLRKEKTKRNSKKK